MTERFLAVSGLALLAAFVIFRAGQAEDRQAGLDAFHATYPNAERRIAADAVAPGRPTAAPRDTHDPARRARVSYAATDVLQPTGSPDKSEWSDVRIRAFEESLETVDQPPLAVLRVDRLNIEVPVYNGTEDDVLDRGAGRILGTAWIDEPGNLGIAAHRDGFFRPLKDIQIGDILHLVAPNGIQEYEVERTSIVTPDDVSVLDPTDEPVITLVTCYPFYFVGSAPERFIVTARARGDSSI